MQWKEIGTHAAVMITAFVLTPLVVCALGGLMHLLFYLVCGIGIFLLCIAAVLLGIDVAKSTYKWFQRRKMIFC